MTTNNLTTANAVCATLNDLILSGTLSFAEHRKAKDAVLAMMKLIAVMEQSHDVSAKAHTVCHDLTCGTCHDCADHSRRMAEYEQS